jgi:hypothetical protein
MSDALEEGNLRLYVFQLGNGCMDVANELGLIEKGCALELVLNGLAEILHRLADNVPYKEEVIAERKRREKTRKAK